jgi:hypothetical protein
MSEDKSTEKTRYTIDLDLVFKTVEGRVMQNTKLDDMGMPIFKERREGDNRVVYEREPLTMRSVIVTALTSVTEKEQKENSMKGRQKLLMDKLAEKVMKHPTGKKMTLTVSQGTYICRRVNLIYPAQRATSIVWTAFDYNVPEDLDNFEDLV